MGFCCWSWRNGENGELGKDVVKYMTTAGGDVAKQEGGTLKNGSPIALTRSLYTAPNPPKPVSEPSHPTTSTP